MKTCPKCGVEYPETTTLCPADGVALERSGDSLLGKVLSGKYRVDALISEGGMGSVYRGTHVLMEKTVAIKVLRPALAADPNIVARFSREARAASRISHPNALSVTDFGEDESGTVFLVMEYLSGKTLKQVIRDDGPMALGRVVDIMRQVGDALSVAHGQGVIHRDLKSDNIMLLGTLVGDHAKVLDFGIAKINEPEAEFDTSLTAPNLVIGTPQYMSPEQCSQDSELDARSDIYSFGVILYEMLVGHVPFAGESPTKVMMMHLQEPVPSVLDERTDIPESVGRVVSKAMAKVPANRYQTVNELIEDLTIAAGMTVNPMQAPSIVNELAADQEASGARAEDDQDEVTVVSARYTPPASTRRAPLTVPVGQPPQARPASSLNPFKIVIPAAVALLVVFAAIYAFSGGSAPTANLNGNLQQQPALVTDPNSQPVKPAQPPSGKGEEGIPAGGNITPPANVNANANANAEVSPSPVVEISPSANANANSNSNKSAPPLPEPTKVVTPENVPVPTPGGSKSPAEKPTPEKPPADKPAPAASPAG